MRGSPGLGAGASWPRTAEQVDGTRRDRAHRPRAARANDTGASASARSLTRSRRPVPVPRLAGKRVLARRPDRRPDGTAALGVAPRSLRLGGVSGPGFRFSVPVDSGSERLFPSYGHHGPHAFFIFITDEFMYLLQSPRRSRIRSASPSGASAPAPGPSRVAPPISRRVDGGASPAPLPFPHLCYDLGVPPRPPPLHERVHAAIGMLRVPPSPCESLPRQAYGYPLTVLHAAARAAHLTGSAEDARASSLSRHMRP